MFVSLFGLGSGMMLPVFHICGMMLVLMLMLYVVVRCFNAWVPRCFRCCMHDFLFLLCSCVSDIGVLLSLLIMRSILRYVLSVVCCIMLLN